MIDNLDDRIEGDFHDLAVRPLNFYAGCAQRLSSFHAAHDAAHAMSIFGNDFYIAFAVQRRRAAKAFVTSIMTFE